MLAARFVALLAGASVAVPHPVELTVRGAGS